MSWRSPSARLAPTNGAGAIWMRLWRRWSISSVGPGTAPSPPHRRSALMSRSPQKNYLDRLLTPEGTAEQEAHENAQRASPPLGSPLLTRANTLERIGSGELKQVAQVRVDPKRCRIWPGNGRNYATLNYERCKDLIDSMIAEGGQKVPALVRKLKSDPDHDYEVIYGSRRHWATSWLRTNNYPEFVFLAEVRDLDDEAAFRLADLENRARQDITEFERAKNYSVSNH